ncbi:unnamed protein product [Rotaria socialis]|uniref:Uncharacterized protein n=2 Tax=Rotaria TaxID=231623 RepID=A0A818ADD6_9BILA|nr:unnamed protein product [Rotaria socialis]CAF3402925.1 unnamed protein product [Rotaria socialis]CAF3443462.1 unnamed protein product [Rotaria socialis]
MATKTETKDQTITWEIIFKLFFIGFLSAGFTAAVAVPVTIKIVHSSSTTITSTTTLSTVTTVTTSTSTSVTTTTTITTTTTTTTSAICTYPCRCTGISSYTLWQILTNDTISMTVDTSSCNFYQTPTYFTSLFGTSSHWTMIGYNAIYSPANSSFTVHLRYIGSLSSSTLLTYASNYLWNVHWFGTYS